MSLRIPGALLLAVGLALASPAVAAPNAKDFAAAKKANKEGQQLEKKKAFEEAKAAYQKSLELSDNPDTRIRLAGVERELGNLVEAAEQLRKALEAPGVSFAQKKKAESALKKLEKRIPLLTLDLPQGFSGKVRVGDRELGASELSAPVELNPGTHEVRAEADGYKPFTESVTLAEKDKKNLSILMTELPQEKTEPEPEPAPVKKEGGGDKTFAYISLGVGVVGLAVGTYMGLKAKSTKSELDDSCRNNVCTDAEKDTYDRGKSQANIATAGFIVGGVGIGLGTVLLLSGGGKEGKVEARRATPYVGLGHAGFAGQF